MDVGKQDFLRKTRKLQNYNELSAYRKINAKTIEFLASRRMEMRLLETKNSAVNKK